MVAEAGVEDALIRLLREPSYSGSTVPVGNFDAAVTVTTTGSTKTIESVGVVNDFKRKIVVEADYSNNLIVNFWREVNY